MYTWGKGRTTAEGERIPGAPRRIASQLSVASADRQCTLRQIPIPSGMFDAVRCEPLDLGYIDGMLILPLIIEHTIDERSPLCGHTYDSLEVGALRLEETVPPVGWWLSCIWPDHLLF
jgi:hypothetical protein